MSRSTSPRRPRFARVALLGALLGLMVQGAALAQINVGSNGSDGALMPTIIDVDQDGIFWIDLSLADTTPTVAGNGVYDPARWAVIFQYTDVVIPTGVRVKFRNHASRAAVVWLVQNHVNIEGEIDLDGADGHAVGAAPSYAEPGPGGFRGARGGQGVSGSPGFGPGGGPRWIFVPGAVNQATWTGAPGGHSEAPWSTAVTYGNASLFPLFGGSGGGGLKGANVDFGGGGAGAGAVLIGADDGITVTGSIHADGGDCPSYGAGGSGSGGSIRLVSDVIELGDAASVRCLGGAPCQVAVGSTLSGSPGRIRIEGNQLTLPVVTSPHPSLDLPGPMFPLPSAPSVRIVDIDGVSAPTAPLADFVGPFADVKVDDPGMKTVTIEGQNIAPGAVVQVRVASTFDDSAWFDSTPLMATGVAGVTTAVATVQLVEGVSTLQLRVVLP